MAPMCKLDGSRGASAGHMQELLLQRPSQGAGRQALARPDPAAVKAVGAEAARRLAADRAGTDRHRAGPSGSRLLPLRGGVATHPEHLTGCRVSAREQGLSTPALALCRSAGAKTAALYPCTGGLGSERAPKHARGRSSPVRTCARQSAHGAWSDRRAWTRPPCCRTTKIKSRASSTSCSSAARPLPPFPRRAATLCVCPTVQRNRAPRPVKTPPLCTSRVSRVSSSRGAGCAC